MRQSAGLKICVISITLLLVLYVAWQMNLQGPNLLSAVPEDVFAYESTVTVTSEGTPPEEGSVSELAPPESDGKVPSQSVAAPAPPSLPGDVGVGGKNATAPSDSMEGGTSQPLEGKATSGEELSGNHSSASSPLPSTVSSREDSFEPSPPAASEAASRPSDNSGVLSSEPEPVPSEDLAGLDAENDRAAAKLEEKYAVSIRLLREEGSWMDSGVAVYATDPHDVQKGLAELSRALSVFPDRFFEGEVTFVLAGRLHSPGISQPQEGVYLLPCRESFAAVLRDMLVQEAAGQFSRECGLDFTSLNPADFSYGEPEKRLVYSSSNIVKGYFLSLAAQENQETELAELLGAILTRGSTLLRISPEAPLYQKISACCSAASEWRPSLRENRVVEAFL